MIGILLAFQVNSWNDQRKTKLLEIDILKELKQNSIVNIHDMDENVLAHKRALKSSQIISSVLENDLPYNDSIENHFSNILIVSMFLPTSSADDYLKQNGTRIINNESIRFEIIKLHETDYIFAKDVIDNERVKMYNDLNGIYRREFNSIDFFGKSHPVNFDKLIKNQEYSNYVNYQKTISIFILNWYQLLMEKTNKLITNINLELDRLS